MFTAMPPKKATAAQKGKMIVGETSQTRRTTRAYAQSVPEVGLQSASSATPPLSGEPGAAADQGTAPPPAPGIPAPEPSAP